MKSTVLIVLLSCFFHTVQAQEWKGTVYDAKTKEPLSFVTISLINPETDSIFSYTYSDSNGLFEFPAWEEPVILKADIMGYKSFSKNIQKADFQQENLEIFLEEDPHQLEEVQVTGKRKAVTMVGDKLIFDVEKAGIGSVNNGLEVLRELPGITLDKDENVQFRGNGNVQFMINGKRSLLKGEALREYIRSLNAENIDKMEIIAQPSAKYEASGTAGIINIKLKKPKQASFSGNLYSSVAYAEYFKHKHGVNMYYNDSLLSINLDGYFYEGNSVNHRNITQRIQLEDHTRVLEQENEWLPKSISKNISLGIERSLSQNHKLSTSWSYYDSNSHENTFGNTNELHDEKLYKQTHLETTQEKSVTYVMGNVFYNYTSDSLRTKLDIQLNYANYQQKNSGFLENSYPVNPLSQPDFELDINQETQYDLFIAQADFSHKVNRLFSLETGVKFSAVKNDYGSRYETTDPDQLFIPQEFLTNNFTYKEQVFSFYAQGNLSLENWNFLVGLRGEFIDYSGRSYQVDETNSNEYLKWFPSFSANYKKGEHQYSLRYSRRIGRPNYLDLNPYYEYIDPYSVQKGNPNLQPQLYHSFEIAYIYRSALSASLYGYMYDNKFVSVIDYREGENYNLLYQANGGSGNRFGISLSAPYDPTDWWDFQLNANGYYSHEKSVIRNFSYDESGYGYDLNLYQHFTFPKKWFVNLSGFYNGISSSGNQTFKPSYDVSISVKKMLWNDKLKLELSCQNILKKSQWHSVTKQDNVTTNWINQWETGKFGFTATYNFGSGKSKNIKAASLNEERNRM